MRRIGPKALLFVLIGAVPLAVVGSGLASFLLLRAGYGPLVWAGLPFLGLMLAVGVLGLVLGLAASGPRSGPSSGREDRSDG